MFRFLIDMTDSTAKVVIATAWNQAYGYLHFTDEEGETFYSVDARSVSGIRQVNEHTAIRPEPTWTKTKAASTSI